MFPIDVPNGLLDEIGYISLNFTRVCGVLRNGKIRVNHVFKAASNLSFAMQRDRSWFLCAPLAEPHVLREWDMEGLPYGPPIMQRRREADGTYARNPDGTFQWGMVMVDGTTGYQKEQVGKWQWRIWKPNVIEPQECYAVDMKTGTCTCQAFIKRGYMPVEPGSKVKPGCKHADNVWLGLLLGK